MILNSIQGGSKGYQPKAWSTDGTTMWKFDTPGQTEGLTEVIVSKLLDFVTISGKPVNHVRYEVASNGRIRGCSCKNYLRPFEAELTLKNIQEARTFEGFKRCFRLNPVKHQIAEIFALDWLVRNVDRHLGNVTLLTGSDGKTRLAPAYDFGDSLHLAKGFVPQPYGKEQLEWTFRHVPKRGIQVKYREFRGRAGECIDTRVYPIELWRGQLEKVRVLMELAERQGVRIV